MCAVFEKHQGGQRGRSVSKQRWGWGLRIEWGPCWPLSGLPPSLGVGEGAGGWGRQCAAVTQSEIGFKMLPLAAVLGTDGSRARTEAVRGPVQGALQQPS